MNNRSGSSKNGNSYLEKKEWRDIKEKFCYLPGFYDKWNRMCSKRYGNNNWEGYLDKYYKALEEIPLLANQVLKEGSDG